MASELDVLLVAEALVTDAAEAAPISLAWAMYLGSPVSASWLALGPQTNIIARNHRLQCVTDDVCGSDVP